MSPTSVGSTPRISASGAPKCRSLRLRPDAPSADVSDVDLGVIITDSFSGHGETGIVNVAIGVAGCPALADYRGQEDFSSRMLSVTKLRWRTRSRGCGIGDGQARTDTCGAGPGTQTFRLAGLCHGFAARGERIYFDDRRRVSMKIAIVGGTGSGGRLWLSAGPDRELKL